MTLFRAMQSAPDGYPQTGSSARTLGARPIADIPIDPAGNVSPKTGGMSTVVIKVQHLPVHRRPIAFGGTEKDPVYTIEETHLPPTLIARQSGKNPYHYILEPQDYCPFEDYKKIYITPVSNGG